MENTNEQSQWWVQVCIGVDASYEERIRTIREIIKPFFDFFEAKQSISQKYIMLEDTKDCNTLKNRFSSRFLVSVRCVDEEKQVALLAEVRKYLDEKKIQYDHLEKGTGKEIKYKIESSQYQFVQYLSAITSYAIDIQSKDLTKWDKLNVLIGLVHHFGNTMGLDPLQEFQLAQTVVLERKLVIENRPNTNSDK